jgi:hypothetical protein
MVLNPLNHIPARRDTGMLYVLKERRRFLKLSIQFSPERSKIFRNGFLI